MFERDRYQCKICEQTNLETHLTVNHIIPLARSAQKDISHEWIVLPLRTPTKIRINCSRSPGTK